MISFDSPENIRKPLVFCFQWGSKGYTVNKWVKVPLKYLPMKLFGEISLRLKALIYFKKSSVINVSRGYKNARSTRSQILFEIMFLKNSQISQENTCVGESLFNKVAGLQAFIEKYSSIDVFL